ncbi:hypothetical protein MRX96_039266, partial [Rhipicephalus microplus]
MPGKATTVNAEKNEETEKNGSNKTDGTENVNDPNNGTIENEESKRTDSGSTGKSGSGGDDEKIKAEGSSEKELTKAGVKTTDDDAGKSLTKQKKSIKVEREKEVMALVVMRKIVVEMTEAKKAGPTRRAILKTLR